MFIIMHNEIEFTLIDGELYYAPENKWEKVDWLEVEEHPNDALIFRSILSRLLRAEE